MILSKAYLYACFKITGVEADADKITFLKLMAHLWGLTQEGCTLLSNYVMHSFYMQGDAYAAHM